MFVGVIYLELLLIDANFYCNQICLPLFRNNTESLFSYQLLSILLLVIELYSYLFLIDFSVNSYLKNKFGDKFMYFLLCSDWGGKYILEIEQNFNIACNIATK